MLTPFCCLRFAKLLQNPHSQRQFGTHLNVLNRLVAVPLLIMLRHFLVRMAQKRLDVIPAGNSAARKAMRLKHESREKWVALRLAHGRRRAPHPWLC